MREWGKDKDQKGEQSIHTKQPLASCRQVFKDAFIRLLLYFLRMHVKQKSKFSSRGDF